MDDRQRHDPVTEGESGRDHLFREAVHAADRHDRQ
jgi:hypothetical protein